MRKFEKQTQEKKHGSQFSHALQRAVLSCMRDAVTILSVIARFDLQPSLKISVLAIFEKSEMLVESLIENWQDGSVCGDELAGYDHL